MPLTFRVKARRYPLWNYAIAGFFVVFGSVFWTWVAYSALAVTLSVARQVFIVLLRGDTVISWLDVLRLRKAVSRP